MLSQERLKIKVKLLLSVNRNLDMPRRLAQQRMISCLVIHSSAVQCGL